MQNPENNSANNVRTKIHHRIDAVLEGTTDHYSCYLPGDLSPVSSFILKKIFSGIKIDESQTAVLQKIPEDAVVVYVNKFRSYFERLFYYSRYRELGLPFPEIGFDTRIFFWQPVSRLYKIALAHLVFFKNNLAFPNPFESGYIRDALAGGKAGLLSLIDKKRFYRWFVKAKTDPVRYLIEAQMALDRPIYIIPQLMFFSKKPIRSRASFTNLMFGTETRPGKIRRLMTLFGNPGKVFVEISEPLNLKAFINQEDVRTRPIEYQALLLRRNLLRQLNQHRQSITGPVLKSREERKEDILTGDTIQNYIQQYATENNLSVKQVQKEAESYLEEISAKYSISVIKVCAAIVTWIINIMFDGVVLDQQGLNRLKSASLKSPLILIPCHKSHIDYLMLSYVMFYNDMPCPHIFAGRNLSFWPMGFIFRHGGAFFVRRTFKGAALYSKIFSEYIYNLLSEGFNIEAFIEGTRSRTGKLLSPKFGFLSILVDAYQRGACSDLQFAPIYIGYDRVLEENAYLHELEGGQKKPENFIQVIKAARFLRKRYGKIYIQFHEPISLNALLSGKHLSGDELTPETKTEVCRMIGNKVVTAINRMTVVTPHSLIAAAALNSPGETFSSDDLMDIAVTYLTYLHHGNVMLSDTLAAESTKTLRHVIDIYSLRKIVEPASLYSQNDSTPSLYRVRPTKRPVLEYYKNNCISFFIPAAYTAIEIRHINSNSAPFTAEALYPGYAFLQEFLQKEFVNDIDKPSEYHVASVLRTFTDMAMLDIHPEPPDHYTPGINFDKLPLFAGFLRPYLEAHWVVLDYIRKHPKRSLNDRDILKKTVQWGDRLYKDGIITLKESLFTINFKNGIDYFLSCGITDHTQSSQIEYYFSRMNNYLKYL